MFLVCMMLKLQEKSRERKNQGLFIVEGTQENELAVKGDLNKARQKLKQKTDY